jgi:hypothetical protein
MGIESPRICDRPHPLGAPRAGMDLRIEDKECGPDLVLIL